MVTAFLSTTKTVSLIAFSVPLTTMLICAIIMSILICVIVIICMHVASKRSDFHQQYIVTFTNTKVVNLTGGDLHHQLCGDICGREFHRFLLVTFTIQFLQCERVTAVTNFPIPQSVREVRQFLGLASYYHRFVQGFAKIAQPIHTLTQKLCESFPHTV